GSQFLVKDGSTPEKCKILVKAKEPNSDDTLYPDVLFGSTLTVSVNGGSETQTFSLPAGVDTKGKPFWTNTGKSYKYKDSKGENGPVSAAAFTLSGGTLQFKASVSGKLGTISIVPPNPGTDACVLLAAGHFAAYSVNFATGTVSNTATQFKVKD